MREISSEDEMNQLNQTNDEIKEAAEDFEAEMRKRLVGGQAKDVQFEFERRFAIYRTKAQSELER